MLKTPIFYATLSFISSLIIIHISIPGLSCMDGWKPPSIGLSGICPHHDGASHTPIAMGLSVSYIIAFITWKKAKKYEAFLKKHKSSVIQKSKKASYGLLNSLNSLLCRIWNSLVKALCKFGLGRSLKKAPIPTIVVIFIVASIYPPLTLFLYLLTIIAYTNEARTETGCLVPDKTNKS